MQHSLRHPEGSFSGDSLPTTALNWFHFSAMRRLLLNSGKCLMSEAALDIFVGSLIQQAMASELEKSFNTQANSPLVRTYHNLLMQLPLSFCDGAHEHHTLPKFMTHSYETAGWVANTDPEWQISKDAAHFNVQRILC